MTAPTPRAAVPDAAPAAPPADVLDAVERTSLLTAALRAAETAAPDRLFDDPYAAALAGDLGPRLLGELRTATLPADGREAPSTPDYNAIRTRYLDELLQSAAHGRGLRQIVHAPAGMDTRAHRLPWPQPVRFFEIDRPAVLAYKQQRLAGRSAPVADHRTVAADLTAPGWEERLLDAGYRADEPSAWVLEGLLYYLPEPEVHRLLERIAGLTAPGSLIAADLVNEAALTQPGMRPLLRVFEDWGCPWVFGTDEPERLFARHGFEVTAVQPGEPGADFGRWPDPVPPRTAAGVRRVFFVHGERH